MWSIVSVTCVCIVAGAVVVLLPIVIFGVAMRSLERGIRGISKEDAPPGFMSVLFLARARIELFYERPTPARFIRARREIRNVRTWLALHAAESKAV